MNTTALSIVDELVDIYFTEEPWHKTWLTREQAYDYHIKGLIDGSIQIYRENNELIGYYERHFFGSTCYLYNVYIKSPYRQGRVFKAMRRHFFDTMPKGITHIEGDKHKLGGKKRLERIRKEKFDGNY